MSVKIAVRSITLAVALCAIALPATAQDEDHGVSSGAFNDAMSEIPALTAPTVTLDFDLMPQGPTTVAAIQAAFPNSGVTNVVHSACTGAAAGVYNFQPNGRALAANPDGSLGLFLVDPPSGPFGCYDDVTITFAAPITQFGVQIGDWSGPINLTVFDGAANVGTLQVTTTNAPTHLVESTVPFDSLMISAFPDNPQANYVVPTLIFPEQAQQGDADLAISKTGQATSPTTGTYTIRVENLGPDDATGVIVNDTLPAGVTYVSDTCGGMMGTPWTWNVGDLMAGANTTCIITVDIIDPANTDNTADVTGRQNDPNLGNNTAMAQIPPFGGPIPTLGTSGIVLLVVLIAGVGFFLMRRFF